MSPLSSAAARRHAHRRARLGVESLEGRVVLSHASALPIGPFSPVAAVQPTTSSPIIRTAATGTQAQSGQADGMPWRYSYNPSTNSWNLALEDRLGTGRVTIRLNGNALQFNTTDNGVFAGPTLPSTNGVTGSITLYRNPDVTDPALAKYLSSDKPVVNASGFPMTTVTRTSTQTGTALGLSWRYDQENYDNTGTLYVQDKAATDRTGPGATPVYINQMSGHMTFDQVYPNVVNGPAVGANTKVAIVVAEHSGDTAVYDDRSGAGGISFKDRLVHGQDGNDGVTWDVALDVVAKSESVTITSAPRGSNTPSTSDYQITLTSNTLNQGDPGYEPDYSAQTELQWADSQNLEAGPTLEAEYALNITVKQDTGDYQFKAASTLPVTPTFLPRS